MFISSYLRSPLLNREKTMKILKITFTTILFLGLFIAPTVNAKMALARSDSGQNCKMVETATLGINFNNVPIELKSSKSYVQQKADEILTLAADLAIEDIHIQNMNYNIYTNNYGGCNNTSTPSSYQLNGNVSFQMPNAENAEKLMEFIGEKGYNVNFNMNAYRQCQ